MKCYACDNGFVEHIGTLELPSKIIGAFVVDNVSYFKCEHCQEVILPENTWKIADQEEEKQLKKFLSNLPIKNFIGASNAASILGMTRQALHKHRRIRRGFIYSITHEDKILYHAESVKLFRETGDGRFPLKKEVTKREKEYVVVTVPYFSNRNRFHDYGGREEITGWNPAQNTLPLLTGHIYD